ncbi:hypothetical protein D3C71_1539510 [compost metagenome]
MSKPRKERPALKAFDSQFVEVAAAGPAPGPLPPNKALASGSVIPRRTEIDSRSARICLATWEKVSPRSLLFMIASTRPELSASRPLAAMSS